MFALPEDARAIFETAKSKVRKSILTVALVKLCFRITLESVSASLFKDTLKDG